jgi:aspartate/methionine/tyrosine aminotransferase
MELPPFLLDHWLAAHEFASPPIAYNLAASTGPRWTLGEVLALDGGQDISDVAVSYAPPEGSRALREAVAAFHGVDPDWVVVTTGASEALSILFCLAAEPNVNIVLPSPGFPAFEAMAQAWGLGCRHYRLARDAGYRQSAENVLEAVDRDTALALVSTPQNPTGSAMTASETTALAGKLADRGVPLIVDEVYHPLYFGTPVPSAAPIENVIVVSDMSKALSLAGLRMGWIIDRDPERRKRIIDARSYFTISGSPVLEAIATHALRQSCTILDRLSAVATANMAALERFMEEQRDTLSWVEPEGGTVSFPWFRDGRDSRPFATALARQGVLVVPGDCFGMPEHMRVGFGAQAEGFEQALAIFGRTLRGAS